MFVLFSPVFLSVLIFQFPDRKFVTDYIFPRKHPRARKMAHVSQTSCRSPTPGNVAMISLHDVGS